MLPHEIVELGDRCLCGYPIAHPDWKELSRHPSHTGAIVQSLLCPVCLHTIVRNVWIGQPAADTTREKGT